MNASARTSHSIRLATFTFASTPKEPSSSANTAPTLSHTTTINTQYRPHHHHVPTAYTTTTTRVPSSSSIHIIPTLQVSAEPRDYRYITYLIWPSGFTSMYPPHTMHPLKPQWHATNLQFTSSFPLTSRQSTTSPPSHRNRTFRFPEIPIWSRTVRKRNGALPHFHPYPHLR